MRMRRVTLVHSRNLANLYSYRHQDYMKHSALGYVNVYNLLPERVIASETPKLFQSRLQHLVKEAASHDVHAWEMLFSPRLPIHSHIIMQMS